MKRIGQRYVQFINRTYRRSSRFDLDPADLREIRLAANGGFALGNARFKAEIAEMIGRRVERLRDRVLPRFSS